MGKKRRTFTPDFRAKVALAATTADQCKSAVLDALAKLA
jgi:hypothetical protein